MDEQRITRVLGVSILLGFGMLLLWLLTGVVMGDFAFYVHSRVFNLERVHFDLMNYFGMGFLKLLIIVFFLIPYVALKITGRR